VRKKAFEKGEQYGENSVGLWLLASWGANVGPMHVGEVASAAADVRGGANLPSFPPFPLLDVVVAIVLAKKKWPCLAHLRKFPGTSRRRSSRGSGRCDLSAPPACRP